MRLYIKDLREVNRLLRDISRKWYDIGIELGLTADELKNIKANCDSVEECLREMLDKWLRNIDPLPTWRALGDALKFIGEGTLAEAGILVH